MSKKMLINVLQAEESRVAIVADGILDWIEIETGSRGKLKGNIYKGVVETVNTSLQAAFVKFGPGRAGFLPMDEINFRTLPPPKRAGGGKGKAKAKEERSPRGRTRPRIGDLLRSGQELLVQVVREPFGTKPPSLSTFFSLPGRYLVLLPGSESSGISRKIEDEAGRDRLKKIIRGLTIPEEMGVIVRTAGLDQTKAELNRDMRYLTRLWTQIEKAAEKIKPPSLIYQERDLVLRAIRDLYSPDIQEVILDNEEVYKRAVRYFKTIMPGKQKLVRLDSGDEPLFSRYDIEDQIETIYKRRVALKSGGAIVIDETEALTSIDVNSGKTREGSIEETASRANLEAADEAARQLRLRDIGGLVVIDFIDMRSASSIRAVEKRLREAMRQDKARHDMTRISKLGLLEMSRQRLRSTTASSSYETCPECDGGGVIKTVESAAVALLRRVHTRAARGDLARIRLLLPTGIATYLLNRKREDILRLEQRYETEIVITGRSDLRANDLQFEVEGREAVKREERQSQIGQEPHVKHPEMLEEDDDKPRRRPRRRRRGDERREGDAAETPTAVTGSETAEETPPVDTATAKKPVRRRRRRTTERREGDVAETPAAASETAEETPAADTATAKKPARRRRRRTTERREGDAAETPTAAAASETAEETPAADTATAKKPARRRRRRTTEHRDAEPEESPAGGGDEEAKDATGEATPTTTRRRRSRGGRSRRSRSARGQKDEPGSGQEGAPPDEDRLLSGPPDVVSGPDDEWNEDLPSRDLRADGGSSESSR